MPRNQTVPVSKTSLGLTPSPAILASTVKHHLSKYEEKEPAVTSLLVSCLYVDDLAGGVFYEKETVDLYDKVQGIRKEVGFSLRKWNSNCQLLLERIKQDEESKTETTMEAPPNKHESAQNHEEEGSSEAEATKSKTDQFVKTLGIYWDVIRDEFHFDVSELIEYAEFLPVTKRSMLKLSAKVFDPTGLLSPFTVSMKILFQSLCIQKVNWDESLEGEALAKWNSFTDDLKALKNIRVPRRYTSHPMTVIHMFVSTAWVFRCLRKSLLSSCVPENRMQWGNTSQYCGIKYKSKRQTIPRLELLGATLLTQLVHSTRQPLPSILQIQETFLWTYSFTVHCWIKNAKT